MTTVGYFCTAGYTEGSIEAFLRKINDKVTWVRCLPAMQKPNPKLGRPYPIPETEHNAVK